VDLSAEVTQAVSKYCEDVRTGGFPSDAESYHSPAELRERVPAPQRS
jgi:ketopantoate hydroxymethyltransferase